MTSCTHDLQHPQHGIRPGFSACCNQTIHNPESTLCLPPLTTGRPCVARSLADCWQRHSQHVTCHIVRLSRLRQDWQLGACLQNSFSSCLCSSIGRLSAPPYDWPRIAIMHTSLCLQCSFEKRGPSIWGLVKGHTPHEAWLEVIICWGIGFVLPVLSLTGWQICESCSRLQRLNSYIQVTCRLRAGLKTRSTTLSCQTPGPWAPFCHSILPTQVAQCEPAVGG